jgi:xylitol oxidase
MKKRTFLKLTTSLITGAALSNFTSCSPEKTQQPSMKNWAGNLTYSTKNVFEPRTISEVQEVVKKCDQLRTLGTRHCFNRIADSTDNLLSTKYLNDVISLDVEKKRVTVAGGIRYGELCEYLHERGFAVHNLASLPHISVAGACATATHGSGVANGNLAKSVVGIEFIAGNGEIVTLTKENDGDRFLGAIVALGSLGVVTAVTLELVPAFSMQQEVYLDLPMQKLSENFDAIMSAGYSVSLFTDWQSENINQVWVKRKLPDSQPIAVEKEFYGATAATRNVHPIIEISAENCTEQMGVAGPWYDRLPHFKMGFTPSSGEELQAEYFVPRDRAVEAINAVYSLRDEIKPVLMISEIRTVASDDLWLSMAYKQDCVAIHFTLTQDTDLVMALLPKIEQQLSPFGVRPHWGKLFTIDPNTLQSRYERIADFKKLMEEYDPQKKFVNEFVEKNILNVSGDTIRS